MDQQAFTELLAGHKDRLYSHALYSLRDAHDAEDITQEAFLRLWRSYDRIDPTKVGAWLTRVTHNLCVDHARRRQIQRSNLGQPDSQAVDTLATVADTTDDPLTDLYLDEQQRALLAALATLTPETRSVMIMHYFQDMKLHEIGAVLDKTVSALKVQIHRARKSLRLALTTPAEAAAQTRRGTG